MEERGYGSGPTEGCRQFDLELEAYLEGEARPGVREHARRCAFCHALLADLEQIRSVSLELTEAEPPAALWANVRAALVAEGLIRERPRPGRRWFSAGFWWRPVPVASLACLVVIAVALVKPSGLFPPASRSIGSQPAANSALAPTVDLALPAEYQSMAQAVDEMQRTYEAQAASFDPLTKASYEKGLRSLDDEISECLRNVQQEPSDTAARQYLVTAYSAKAEVLQSALEFNGR